MSNVLIITEVHRIAEGIQNLRVFTHKQCTDYHRGSQSRRGHREMSIPVSKSNISVSSNKYSSIKIKYQKMAHNIDPNQEMPYFIKPSVNLSAEGKHEAYKEIQRGLTAILEGETNRTLKMASINCLLKTHLPYAYWVGFYCVENGQLTVGPYQGTLGCLHIDFGKGVCGAVAQSGQTKIVGEVHLLAEGEDHITCDPNSQSEIVVPVFDEKGDLIAVFDVDSSETYSFDEIDQQYLEQMMQTFFGANHQ